MVNIPVFCSNNAYEIKRTLIYRMMTQMDHATRLQIKKHSPITVTTDCFILLNKKSSLLEPYELVKSEIMALNTPTLLDTCYFISKSLYSSNSHLVE
jgi:hypothetical protein